MTLKQSIFLRKYAETLNATRAAMVAYGYQNKNVAAVTGSRLLRNANIRGLLDGAIEVNGLSEEAIARTLRTVIYSGLGVGATTRDSLKVIKLWMKLSGNN